MEDLVLYGTGVKYFVRSGSRMGIAAFVGLCTDEIQKASVYISETYFLSSSKQTRDGQEPRAPFCFVFDAVKSGTDFFGWLEGEIKTTSGPHGSMIVDVGGGISSTSMLLAAAFSSTDEGGLGLKFIIQDRLVVVEMGEKAWKAKCPEH